MMTTGSKPGTVAHRSLPCSSHTPALYDGPSREDVLAMRRQYLTPGLITYYREPLLVVEGHMQYLWDETGKQYLGAFAGIVTVSVGHCHPRIVREGPRAGRPAPAHDDDLSSPRSRATRREAGRAHAPKGSGLSVSYFTSSGSEANEIAILSAAPVSPATWTSSACRNGYHGGTQATHGIDRTQERGNSSQTRPWG